MLSKFLRCAAPITFISSAFTDSAGSNVTSLSLAVPSGKSGDLLIIVWGKNANAAATTPSGWTSLLSETRTNIFYKTATADSESNVTVTTASVTCGAVILRFRFATKTPVAGTVTTATIAGPSTITATEVANSIGADYVLQCYVDGASSKSYSVPSVSTGTVFTESDADQPSISVFYQYSGSSDATSTKTGTSSVVNAFQIRLRK